VSVADICRVSMVSRTTFYDHYTGKDALLAEVVSFLLEDITPALEGLWCGEGGDSRAVARHLADIYARNGRALTTLLAIRVGGEGDLHERLRQTCRSVFADWARGRIDDDVLPLASEVYASVVLTFIERSATKPLSEKELSVIDRARELFIAGFGAQ
jgi:transcriptional regulator, tetR family